jgi:Uma2 family endonuclease
MSTVSSSPPLKSRDPEGTPAWEIAYLFPTQGTWSEEEYLALPGNRLVEFSDGAIEVLPTPTELHHMILLFLIDILRAHVAKADGGKVLPAGIRVRLWPGKIREPDVVFMRKANEARRANEFWTGADLVMEIVSGDAKDREGDLVIKRAEYAKGHIPEYWIVDPEMRKVTVLTLKGDRYEEHGVFTQGQAATSALLPGFAVDVTEMFAVK